MRPPTRRGGNRGPAWEKLEARERQFVFGYALAALVAVLACVVLLAYIGQASLGERVIVVLFGLVGAFAVRKRRPDR
jgi:hypothetical protein